MKNEKKFQPILDRNWELRIPQNKEKKRKQIRPLTTFFLNYGVYKSKQVHEKSIFFNCNSEAPTIHLLRKT